MKAAINKLELKDVEDMRIGGNIDYYQRVSSGSAIYPGQGTPLGLIYCALKLNGEAGELAEHVGKSMRDDGLLNGMYMDHGTVQDGGLGLTEERRELIIKEVGDCLWYLAAVARELDMRLSEIAMVNLRKLYDSQERNALQGSGDNR